MAAKRVQRTYDHSLIRLVRETRDPTIAISLDGLRSTVAAWVRRAPRTVTTTPLLEAAEGDLHVRIARLQRRVAAARIEARARRLEENQARRCAACA